MRRVCILQNGLARGGTDTFVVNLCKGLDHSKFEVTVINPSNKEGSLVREKEVLETGAKIIHTTQLSSFKNKVKHLSQLYHILKKNKTDIFQTNIDLFNGPNLFVAWLAGVPLRCCHSHNGRQQAELKQGMTLPIRVYQKVMKWMCKKFANRYCGCSGKAMEFLYPDLDWKSLPYPTVINNGINIGKYKQSIDIEKKKNQLGLSNHFHILTIGHFIEQKNPLFIAKLFVELCKNRSDIDLIWIGEGKLKEKVVDILNENGMANRVHMLGYRTDINEIMQCADLFLLPSNFEGLGIVAIEAQAAGLPCLLSDKVPEEANCGNSIYLPIDKGVNTWIKKISDMLDGRITLKADENKLDEFSIEHMCVQMTKVFES